ncbi:Dabb family protein [Anaerobacillus sp. MEB173]|uniref:Dabb family protein n=1 Tax=Anaerobacillus sp. MEB173 TaxID=3383345 RepID=UPI003F9316F8
MIQHIVLFKFKPSTTKEEKDNLIVQLKKLKNEIAGIIDLQAGLNFSEKSQGYDFGLSVRFESRKHFEEYGPHPKHQEIVQYLEKIGLAEMIIVDF